jgi:MFS family permease
MSTTKPSSTSSSDSASTTQRVTRGQFLQLFTAVMLPMFLAAADQTLLATATPVIAAEFGQLHDTSWLVTAYLLTQAAMIPVYGRLGDRYGRREMLFVAIGIYVLGGMACASAQSMGWLIAGRVLQGLGGGGLMNMSQAMVAELVPPQERVRFQGYFAIVFTMANVVGPIIGGYTVANASWRWLFAVQVPLALLAGWRLSKLPRGRAHPDAPGLADVGGLVLFIAAITLLLFGLSSGGHRFDWLSLWSVLLFGGAAIVWTVLLLHERRLAAPFFPLDLLRIPTVHLLVATIVCNTACRFAIIFYLPIYFQIGLKMGAGQSGLMLVPIMIGLLVGQQASTQIGLRTGRLHIMPAIGMVIAAAGLLGLALAPPHKVLLITLGGMVGLGLGPTFPCAQLIVQKVAGPAQLGAVTALTLLSRTAGGAMGAAAGGAIIYGLLPDVSLRELVSASDTLAGEDILRAFHVQFAFLAVIATLAALHGRRVPRISF